MPTLKLSKIKFIGKNSYIRKEQKKRQSIYRKFVESIGIIIFGFILISLIDLLHKRIILIRDLNLAWIEFADGIRLIFNSKTLIVSTFLIVCALIFSLIIILVGFLRFIKVFLYIRRNKRRYRRVFKPKKK